MKGEHIELVTGILIGAVVGHLYGPQLATYMPVLVGIVGFAFLLKLLGLK